MTIREIIEGGYCVLSRNLEELFPDITREDIVKEMREFATKSDEYVFFAGRAKRPTYIKRKRRAHARTKVDLVPDFATDGAIIPAGSLVSYERLNKKEYSVYHVETDINTFATVEELDFTI